MEDKFFEFFERSQFIDFKAIVDFFEVGLELLTVIEEADFEEIEEEEKVELFAFFEFVSVFVEDGHHSLYVVEF